MFASDETGPTALSPSPRELWQGGESVLDYVRRAYLGHGRATKAAKASPPLPSADVLVERGIERFLHCRLCLRERPQGISPRDWARIEVGLTPHGLQVWCVRHEANVGHFVLPVSSGVALCSERKIRPEDKKCPPN